MPRRLLLLLALASVAALTALSAAQAATGPTWRGVVVARDATRGSLVVALPGGAVRTVRTTTPLRRFAVGARVRATGSRLADGTFRGGTLTVTGRAARGVVRGIVVRVDRSHARLLLAAGGSVFAVGRTTTSGTRTTRTTQGHGASEVGDLVEVVLGLATGTPQATAVQTIGQASVVQLAGIVTGNAAPANGAPANGAPGSLTLAVAGKGLVGVSVPAALTPPPAFAPGDEVVLQVTVDQAGAFALVSAQAASAVGAAPARGVHADDEHGEADDDEHGEAGLGGHHDEDDDDRP